MAKVDYQSAGVDLEAADQAAGQIARIAQTTYTNGVLAGVGPFSGLFEIDTATERRPVLVSSCDGVGTKLKLAIRSGRHGTIGQDLVNHCVNDILTSGARPLFFLDYLALGRLDPAIVADVVSGIAEACRTNLMALIGGETAEMPGLYKVGDYDIAGFIVGIVERDAIIDGSAVKAGQALIGLAANGPHTNGYSLVRKVLFDLNNFAFDDTPDELKGQAVGDAVMAVHPSYRHAVDALRRRVGIHGMAHVTGGGIEGNLIRILPEGVQAVVDPSQWPPLPVFTFIQHEGQIEVDEMFRVFNMGIGFIVVVDLDAVTEAIAALAEAGVSAYHIGSTLSGQRSVRLSVGTGR
ncbi:MAG TPA: phosphoribosylformylglycinamidine cyclo-ligase [candidate division Zixibacteria bacterium]|jgi:phosphoribosylformylglycinamidine cyclo-ligase